jgi:hypothetical protein
METRLPFLLPASLVLSADFAGAAQTKVQRDIADAQPASERNTLDVYA